MKRYIQALSDERVDPGKQGVLCISSYDMHVSSSSCDMHVSSSSCDMHVSSSSHNTREQVTSLTTALSYLASMYPPPHMTCMYPPPHVTDSPHVKQGVLRIYALLAHFCSRLVRHINCCALNDGLRIVTLDWHEF